MRRLTGKATGSVVNTHYGSANWSGYLDQTSTYFDEVVAHWIQNGSDSTGTNAQSTWVGIGGFNSPDLLQDGTEEIDNSQYAFYEYLGGVTISAYQDQPVHPDDLISANTTYHVAYGDATFTVVDDGTYVVDWTEVGMEVDWYGLTAEFIDERPDWCYPGYCYEPLTDYVKTTWSDARVYTATQEIPVANANPAGIVMTEDGASQVPPCSSSSDVLAYPTSLSGYNFLNYWCRAS